VALTDEIQGHMILQVISNISATIHAKAVETGKV